MPGREQNWINPHECGLNDLTYDTEFSQIETDIGLAAARVAWLPRDLRALGIIKKDELVQQHDKDGELLSSTVAQLADLLEEQAADKSWDAWHEILGPSSLLSDFASYRATTRQLATALGWTGILTERDRRLAKEQKRLPGGSRLDRFIYEHLAACFEDIYGESAGRSRTADGTPDGPFVRFSHAFFENLPYPVSRETIATALRKRDRRSRSVSDVGQNEMGAKIAPRQKR